MYVLFATSGRFTSDTVAIVEKQNQSDSALRIEMWPESHLERLLAGRPAYQLLNSLYDKLVPSL